MTQTFFLSQLRSLALIIIAYCAGRGWLSPQDSGALTAILVPLGAIAGPWIWSIYANINAKLVHADSAAGKVAVIEASHPADALNAASRLAEKVAAVLVVAFLLSFFLAGSAAIAQTSRAPRAAPTTATAAPSPQLVPLTGNAAQDLANLLKRFTIAPAPTTPDEIQTTPCDFTIFSKLTVDNVIPLLEKCAQSVDQNVTAPLIADTQAALDSAKAFNCGSPAPAACVGNGMAIACLVPALSLLKAAAGTPAVTDPTTGKVTTPGTAAGVVLIGEKLDEFVQAGGPSNCKAVVQRTVNGLAAAALTP